MTAPLQSAGQAPGDSLFSIPDTSLAPFSDDLKSKVHYTASDSIRFDIKNQKVFLYGKAVVEYEDLELKAERIELDWESRNVTAHGTLDSTGSPVGLPAFSRGEESFTADVIRYNFDSEKGKITQINTRQGDGYIQGETVKKIDDSNFFIRHGTYTTCDLPHPHYSIAAGKLKVIRNNKILTGPANLTIADVPTPFAIPFGYFPTRKGRSSGIIFPTYGESGRLGFFLKDGGYYFGLNDYVDLALTGDFYSKGSWGTKLYSNYALRYKFTGALAISYSVIKQGEPETPEFSETKDFFVRWNHRQDPRANPNSVLAANVNFGSSEYYQNNISSPNNYLTNTFQSSVAWSKTWPGKPYSLSTSITHSQNTITRDVSMSLPNANFSVNRQYPFRKKTHIGEEKWFEKIGVSYQANMQNTIQTKDTLLFKSGSADLFRSGISHTLPISTSIKMFKHFTFSPVLTYNERWYLKTIRKDFDTGENQVVVDTVNGFRAARDFLFSTSLNTRIYGMLQTKKGKIAAIRHVMSPTVSFGYRPDFSDPSFNAYKVYQIDSAGNSGKYSIFETGIYGGPPSGKYGVIGFSLDNNLEMKTRTVSDTAVTLKKIKLLESLALGASYNLAADSVNWSLISLNGRTTLFDKINVNFSSSFDPYISDSIGRRLNTSELEANNRLARLVNSTGSIGFSLNNNTKPKTSDRGTPDELNQINSNPGDYVDFTIPYNLTVNYSVSYTKAGLLNAVVNQTLNFYGDLALTSKWKVTFSSGYDFKAKDLSYTNLGIYRDLHCWEMRLNWVPFGPQQNYYFQINVKSSVLQDLKLTKKNDIYDR
ncbi:MAG TPA: putative LPS assembly protein LptD [Bacteroidia bacterium]|nr:putative LPS assembly protein LptD [Bacteroidia bacterium]